MFLWLALLVVAAPEADFPAIERLIAAGNYRQALAILENTQPVNAKWHLLASKVFDGLNDPARAVQEAEKALDLEPGNESHHLQLAQIFLTRNTPLPAYEILTEAQQLFSDSLLIRLGKSLALKELQRYEEAEKELAECLRRKPDFGLAFEALATVYLHTIKFGDADQLAGRYITDNPADFRGYYYRAAARHGLMLESKETENLVRHAIRLKPDFAASHALLGKILLESGRTEDAVAALKQAIGLRPDHSPAHYHLANAYRMLGRHAEAAREFEVVRDLKEKERQPVLSLRYHRGKK
jgi:tetratricopeptide (TPR) repeat protein